MSENLPELDARFIGSEADLETRPPKQRWYIAAYKLRLIERADAEAESALFARIDAHLRERFGFTQEELAFLVTHDTRYPDQESSSATT